MSTKNYERAVVAGLFGIGPDGRIWRLGQFSKARKGQLVPLRQPKRAETPDKDGYLRVRTVIKGKRTYIRAARLVWQHFNGDIPEGLDPNHKNGNKRDNRPGNLELLTPGDNTRHSFRVLDRRVAKGERNGSAKLRTAHVHKIRRTGGTLGPVAKRFGVSPVTVSLIRRRKTWRHV